MQERSEAERRAIMAMPQCCYLAKGAKRPSHTTNTIKFDRIPFDPSNSIKRFDLCPFDQKNSTGLQPPKKGILQTGPNQFLENQKQNEDNTGRFGIKKLPKRLEIFFAEISLPKRPVPVSSAVGLLVGFQPSRPDTPGWLKVPSYAVSSGVCTIFL